MSEMSKMKYILKLNRFYIDYNNLELKIKKEVKGLKGLNFEKDNNRYILEASEIGELKSFPEIAFIMPVFIGYRTLESFSTFNMDILRAVESLDFKPKTFKVKVSFNSKIPMSAKSVIKRINTILKKEGMTFSENNPEVDIYVEFDKDDYKNKKYLISVMAGNTSDKRVYRNDRVIVLCNPGSVIEISDFLRLCFVFRIPLWIYSTKERDLTSNLNKAKKMTKGIAYDDFPLTISDKMPSDFMLVGFSKLAAKSEIDLKGLFLKKQKLAFVFGDEKFGLDDAVRSKADIMIKLTSEKNKPLRASHALSYILGLEKALSL